MYIPYHRIFLLPFSLENYIDRYVNHQTAGLYLLQDCGHAKKSKMVSHDQTFKKLL